MTSCILTMSFDRYDTSLPRYGVRGTIDGLDSGVTVAVVLNGDEAHALVVPNGPFAFSSSLSDGAAYTIAVANAPPKVTCGSASGQIAGADATGIAIHCVSTDATLSSLTLSNGLSLSPGFSPGVTDYAGGALRVHPLLPPTDVSVTATVARAGAALAINSVPATSGSPSPVSILPGANPIEVAVTAPDGHAQTTYRIGVTGTPNDYVKASNTSSGVEFGWSVAISGDGSTLAVGSPFENSSATGIDGDEANTGAAHAGAVYVFTRTGDLWAQQAYVKASNTRAGAHFGYSVALSGDGSTLAAGADEESSAATGVDGNQGDASAAQAGATYVFSRNAGIWSQQAYVKASNTRAGSFFGCSVALSGDGSTLSVGAYNESSGATAIDGLQSDTSEIGAGAVYVFDRSGSAWSQQAYVKASNTRASAWFGGSIALSGDGNLLVVGASGESSGIAGAPADQSAPVAGAAYTFTRSGTSWAQGAYLKASLIRAGAAFGAAVAVSSDASTLAIGADLEASDATGVNGDQSDASAYGAGAVYVLARVGPLWAQQAYVKASNTRMHASFGAAVALSADGSTLAVGSPFELSAATGIDGNQADTSFAGAGAAYVFDRVGFLWAQHLYVKASNSQQSAYFGQPLALTGAGDMLVVGAYGESSAATGIDGNQADGSQPIAGAVYVY